MSVRTFIPVGSRVVLATITATREGTKPVVFEGLPSPPDHHRRKNREPMQDARVMVLHLLHSCGVSAPPPCALRVELAGEVEARSEQPSLTLAAAVAVLELLGLVTLPPDIVLVADTRYSSDRLTYPAALVAAARTAKELGLRLVTTPDAAQTAAAAGCDALAATTLGDVIAGDFTPAKPYAPVRSRWPGRGLSDIRGLGAAKRAVMIAAAGGHNLVLFGGLGSGKSLLMRRFVELLPDLSPEHQLDVAAIHSLGGALPHNEIPLRPPARWPHHTVGHNGLFGGGGPPYHVGEVTRAHRGVLVLDDAPEFDRAHLDHLRYTVKQGHQTVVTGRGVYEEPADFVLAMTARNCPAGCIQTCKCSEASEQRWLDRISGLVQTCDVLAQCHPEDNIHFDLSDAEMFDRIQRARQRQSQRGLGLNGKVPHPLMQLPAEGFGLLSQAIEFGGSVMGERLLRVARTIADLDDSDVIAPEHLHQASKMIPGKS